MKRYNPACTNNRKFSRDVLQVPNLRQTGVLRPHACSFSGKFREMTGGLLGTMEKISNIRKKRRKEGMHARAGARVASTNPLYRPEKSQNATRSGPYLGKEQFNNCNISYIGCYWTYIGSTLSNLRKLLAYIGSTFPLSLSYRKNEIPGSLIRKVGYEFIGCDWWNIASKIMAWPLLSIT